MSVRFGLGSGATYSGTAGAWVAGNIVQPTGNVSVVGTNGATFYITGVQLEVGSSATGFEYRQYGTELSLCQRYYWKWVSTSTRSYCSSTNAIQTTNTYGFVRMPVSMRTAPTLTTSGTAGDYGGYSGSTVTTCTGVPVMDTSNSETPLLVFPNTGAVYVVGQAGIFGSASTNGYLGFNSEL